MTLRRAAAAASAGALALGVLAACSGTPGLSDQAVVVATIAPETGADAPGWSEVAVGAAAYFKFLNAHGGVNGRTITYRVTDSTSDPAKTAALWKQLADDNDVYAVLAPPGVDPAEALPADVVDSDIPVVGAPGCPCWSDADDVVGFAPDWRTEGRVLGAYIAAHDKGAKVGYFLEQGAYGEAGAAGLDEELPSSSVVARTTYDPTNTDVRAQIAKLQQAGADVVVAFARPAFSALLRLGFVASDYSPTLVVSNAGGDPATQVTILNGLGKQAQTQVNGLQLVQGMVTDTFVPPPTDLKSSWSKLFQQVHDAYIPQLPFDEHVMAGMAEAYAFADALARAGDDPSRGALLDALSSGDVVAPTLVPLSYGDSLHTGATGTQVAVVRGTSLQLVSTPYVAAPTGGAVEPFHGDLPQAPADGLPGGK